MDITIESQQLSGSFPNYKGKEYLFLFFSNGVTTSRWISPQLLLRKIDITSQLVAQLSGSFL